VQKTNSKLLLTIALPVFNDSEALLETIESLTPEIVGFGDLVEVLVSDNASYDDSTAYFTDALSDIPNSQVVRQKSNLGFAGNLNALANMSNGTYIWYIGAGDTLVAGALSGVIDVLRDRTVSWGTVMGLFNYHRHEEYQNPEVALLLSNSLEPSKTAVFNHAISLNIFKVDIVRNLKSCSGHNSVYLKSTLRSAGRSASYTVERESCHWPHLEAVGRFALENPGQDLTWFEYLPKAILLNSNRNGNWDKSPAAMRIFAQWSEVVTYAAAALPLSSWLANLRDELRGWHLLRFTFMLRQDSTLRSAEILLQQRKMNVPLLFRIGVRLICLLPQTAIELLVWLRRRIWRRAPAHQTAR
jgi:glycosyltransferase involved in cell wall biosynthesis